MRILLLCDDFYHPGVVPIDGTAPLKKNGFDFDIITNANDFSPELLKKCNTVLLCKLNEVSQTDKQPWKTKIVQKAFVDFVENGGGLTVVHSGTVHGADTEELDKLIGCRSLEHPNVCPVTVQPVKPHPVTDGVGLFCEIDEHYRIEIISSDADILLASYSPAQGEESKYKDEPYFNTPAAICPAGYVRAQGKGRICVLTPGHNIEVWLNPHFQKLLSNALKWTSLNF